MLSIIIPKNPKQDIAFSYAIEETRNKGIYDARGLISASFRDINANTNIKSEKSRKIMKTEMTAETMMDPEAE